MCFTVSVFCVFMFYGFKPEINAFIHSFIYLCHEKIGSVNVNLSGRQFIHCVHSRMYCVKVRFMYVSFCS